MCGIFEEYIFDNIRENIILQLIKELVLWWNKLRKLLCDIVYRCINLWKFKKNFRKIVYAKFIEMIRGIIQKSENINIKKYGKIIFT